MDHSKKLNPVIHLHYIPCQAHSLNCVGVSQKGGQTDRPTVRKFHFKIYMPISTFIDRISDTNVAILNVKDDSKSMFADVYIDLPGAIASPFVLSADSLEGKEIASCISVHITYFLTRYVHRNYMHPYKI